MEYVTSADGTRIAYDRSGDGPPLVLVAGTLGTRPDLARLAELLSARFTVFNYDRRGRGDSGDTAPYAVEREIEDIAALIAHAGGTALLYGGSSGGKLALLATDTMPANIRRLAMYEPPFLVSDSRPPFPTDYAEHLDALVSSGHRDRAVAYFMRIALSLADDAIQELRATPDWQRLMGMAHTLVYDGRVIGDTMSGTPLAPGRWASVTVPTLVMHGGDGEAHYAEGAQALADILPNARWRTVGGQEHSVEPEVLAPQLDAFFLS